MYKFNTEFSGVIKQRGAVLVTSLVLMSILAIVAVATMRSSSTDVTIHQSMKNRSNAFQCAEAAVRSGELWLQTQLNEPPVSTDTKPDLSLKQVWRYSSPLIQDIFTKNEIWWATNGETYGPGMTNADYQIGCASEPRFIIELVGIVDDGGGVLDYEESAKAGVDFYRITGFSVGTESNAAVLLQTTYAKRLR